MQKKAVAIRQTRVSNVTVLICPDQDVMRDAHLPSGSPSSASDKNTTCLKLPSKPTTTNYPTSSVCTCLAISVRSIVLLLAWLCTDLTLCIWFSEADWGDKRRRSLPAGACHERFQNKKRETEME